MRKSSRKGNLISYALLACCLSSLAVGAQAPSSGEDSVIQEFDVLIKGEHYAEALPKLEAYTRDHPNSWRSYYQLGYVYFRLHRIQESTQALSHSLVLNLRCADAHRILGYDLNIAGRQDLAIRELLQAVAMAPNSYESHYELGRIYFDQGSYVQAVQELEKARALAPDFVRVWDNLGLAYGAVGDKTKAVECFRKALELNSSQKKQSPWPYIDYGTWCNLQNDFETARKLLVQAVQIDGTFDQAFGELAKAYRGLGNLSKAVEAYQQAIILNPKKAEYHFALAQVYRRNGQAEAFRREMVQFQKMTEAAPRRADGS
jgi:tetratricopeptide (TPR) repeat protein